MRKRGCLVSSLALCVLLAPVAQGKKVTLNVLIWDAFTGMEKPVWQAFEKAHPDISLKVTVAPWDQVGDKFITMKAANLPVDVLFSDGVANWMGFANNGLFMDLSPYLKRDAKTLPKDLIPLAINCMKYDGKPMGVLYNIMGSTGVWYNQRLLQEAGLVQPASSWDDKTWTWDKFVDYGRKLTKKDSSGRFTQMGIDFWLGINLIQNCWSFGGDWFPKAAYNLGYAEKTTLNSPQNIKAYQAIKDLKFKHFCSPSNESRGFTSEGWTSLFKGKLGMWLDPIQTGAVPPSTLKPVGKVAFAPMPLVPEVGRVDGFSWLGALAMCKGTRYPQQAWTFMKWMMTDATKHGNMRFPGNGVRKSAWAETLKAAASLFDVESSRLVAEGSLDYIHTSPNFIMGVEKVNDIVSLRVIPSLMKADAPDIAQQLALAQKEADSVMSRMFSRVKRR